MSAGRGALAPEFLTAPCSGWPDPYPAARQLGCGVERCGDPEMVTRRAAGQDMLSGFGTRCTIGRVRVQAGVRHLGADRRHAPGQPPAAAISARRAPGHELITIRARRRSSPRRGRSDPGVVRAGPRPRLAHRAGRSVGVLLGQSQRQQHLLTAASPVSNWSSTPDPAMPPRPTTSSSRYRHPTEPARARHRTMVATERAAKSPMNLTARTGQWYLISSSGAGALASMAVKPRMRGGDAGPRRIPPPCGLPRGQPGVTSSPAGLDGTLAR